jgi:GT2 family glycosyltransferase
MTAPEVSVVIVNWNAGPALAGCLRSLFQHPPSVPVEVIVVDNASTDGSAEQAVADHPSIRLLANRENRGLAAANNQGIVAARGDAILLSNPDVVYTAGAVDALLAALRRHPRAAVVVPRLSYEDGSLHTSVGDLPTLREALAGRQAQRRAAGAGGFWWDGWSHDEERQVGRGHEAAYLVARRAIEEVGLQDERYFLDWEGIDWTARLAAAGWEVWFTPTAEVIHLGGVSIRQVPFRWIVRSHRGIYRYFASRHPWWRPWLAPLLVGRAGVKLAAAAVSDVYERGHRRPPIPRVPTSGLPGDQKWALWRGKRRG